MRHKNTSLESLRRKVHNIDSDIVRLIGRRFAITRQIGSRKKMLNAPLRNWEVEKTVMQNVIYLANRTGVPVTLAKTIMQQLIAESCRQQESICYTQPTKTAEKILIIGGNGNMGTWFANFFKNQGHDVAIYDITGPSKQFYNYDSLGQGLESSSCAAIATPMEVVPQVIELVTKKKFKGLVFDIASLKDYLKKIISKAIRQGMLLTSIHPLFGPSTRILSDKTICICKCGNPQADKKAENLFKASAVSIVRLGLPQHDRLISYVLSPSHLINIIFVNVLRRSGYEYTALQKVASTTFLSQMTTAASVIHENPGLYFAIQKFNPYKKKLFSELLLATREITKVILQRKKVRFRKNMSLSRAWFGTSSRILP